MRSANGYRLYGEQEIAQILQVKWLLEQGVRIGAAMETVMGASHRPQAQGRERASAPDDVRHRGEVQALIEAGAEE